jgi:uncharacterized damage-inducible protein DinB
VKYREFLISPMAYLAPDKVLEGLSAELAETRVAGAPHSIAEIVAHLTFWQNWFADRCDGRATPIASSAAQGWPEVAPGSWLGVRERFVAGVRALAKVSESTTTRPLTPPIEFPPLASYTIGDALVHVAIHNGHHLGEIILLRQLQGAWPPPAGSWTW